MGIEFGFALVNTVPAERPCRVPGSRCRFHDFLELEGRW